MQRLNKNNGLHHMSGWLYRWLVVISACLTPAQALAGAYLLHEVGFTDGAGESYATDINETGGVSGYGGTPRRAFYWTLGAGATELFGPPGTGSASGLAVNDHGQVAGFTIAADGYHSVLWTPGDAGYSATDLGNIDDPFSGQGASAINVHGSVVGSVSSGGNHGYLWKPTTPNGTAGGLTSLGGGSGADVTPQAINASGIIAGFTGGVNFGDPHAFVWKPNSPNGTTGMMHRIDALPAPSSIGGINNSGQLVGSVQDKNGTWAAFVWSPDDDSGLTGSALNLGFLDGVDPSDPDAISGAQDINNLGVVVGSSRAGDGLMHAFVWTADQGMRDLNDLIDASDAAWTLNTATAINDSGWIAGYGLYDPDGPGGAEALTRAFVLQPIPEPAGIGLLAFSTMLAVRSKRRN